jgi:hypothetical protein
MAATIMTIVILHIVVGFGWALYKLEFQKSKKDLKESTPE